MLGDSSTTVLAPPPPTSTASASSSGGGGGEPPPSQPPVITEEDKGGGIRGGDEGGGGGGDRSFGGGNRWPRQETLALLKIRSDMDVAFRDASLKGPLWEEVSRKLAELGYNRSAKKCKEKFENVYKYHKRTKEGRTGKQEGKTYRFFDQLEAFETHSSSVLLSSSPTLALPPPPTPPTTKPQAPAAAAVPTMPTSNPLPNTLLSASHFSTVLSAAMAASNTTMAAAALPQGIASSQTMNLIVPSFSPSTNPTTLPPSQATNNPTVIPANVTSSFPSFSPDRISNSTSSSTSSDVEIQGRHRRKRKWKDFFERLMTEVMQKQEEMQKRFLEAIEKREHERMVREETWRMQELARINREREILAQERSIAAAKDAAVMAFLQKLSEQQNPGQAQPQQNNPPPTSQPQPPPTQAAPPPPLPAPIPAASAPAPAPAPAPTSQLVVSPVPALPQPLMTASTIDTLKSGNGDHQNFLPTSSSRWPKEEIQALINLRTNLDSKYQENTPKGPLWEEISAGMRKLGYNRNAKRCKEKWENINKYFKKVKESNKKRPEDSKTCPYFHQLDALYKERNKNNDVIDIGGGVSSSNLHFKPENSVPLMVMPEQQWPPAGQEHRPGSMMEDLAAEDHQDDDDDDKDNEDDDEDEAGGYEIVANKSASMSTV